jgi:hypothetical protein
MFTKINKRHLTATALALVCCYGALLTSEPTSEPELVAAVSPDVGPVAAPTAAPQPSAAASHSGLSDLSARLADLEAQLPVAATAEPALADKQRAEEVVSGSGPEPALAEWMLAAIRGEEWDREHTHKVEAELSETLERIPELHAQELECGKRFCRALLVDRRGDDVQLQPLFGAPPFDGEGFTTLGHGGQAEIYFTRAGESLDALRKEARL